MKKKEETLLNIIKIAKKHEEFRVEDIIWLCSNRTQAWRYLQILVDEWRIIVIKRWVYVYKQEPKEYLEKPFFERTKMGYSSSFLTNYEPNETYFLSKIQRDALQSSIWEVSLDTQYYLSNKNLLEKILIDISFSSSALEGNAYSYLDTEVLIKYSELAEYKAKEDATMILNHKNCIEFIIHNKNNFHYTKKDFCEIQEILWKNLLSDMKLWVFRDTPVDIWWSQYTPLVSGVELNNEFEIFLEKLTMIINPWEKSLFILVFVSYFQAFADVNKRTARMACNIPLIQDNLPVLSLLNVKKSEYITAILAVYELQDVSLLASLYTKNYLERAQRY